jgi:hypothetical protein
MVCASCSALISPHLLNTLFVFMMINRSSLRDIALHGSVFVVGLLFHVVIELSCSMLTFASF